MTLLPQRTFSVLALLFTATASLLAQAENESPYSSSTVDTPPGDSYFADNGFIIAVVAVFVLIAIFLVLKGRRRA